MGQNLGAVSGYPSATSSSRQAVYYTKNGELSNLVTNGNLQADGSLQIWHTINFPKTIPSDYDKSETTNRQWLRIGVTAACNLFVTNVTSDGTATIVAPEAVFESEYAALYPGLVAKIYDEHDVLLATTTVAARTSDTILQLAGVVPMGAKRKIRIVAGGFHEIFIDKIHLGFQQNTSYAPNPFDARVLQPVAGTSNATQGTFGAGGSGGGIVRSIQAMPL